MPERISRKSKIKAGKKTEIDLISLAVHQLERPLSAINVSLKMLLEGDFGSVTKEQRHIIRKILERNKAMIFLVNDFFNVEKFGSKGLVYKWTMVDIEKLVGSVVKLAQEEISNKKIRLELEKTRIKMPKIMADEEKIGVAIQNLIDNAVKYTPPGGKIKISYRVKGGEKGSRVEFKVQDYGIGIPEDQKKDLFTKFFRGRNVVKMNIVGSGLGLCIVKSIIEGHRGKVWFKSKDNQGSTFFFTIPVRQKD